MAAVYRAGESFDRSVLAGSSCAFGVFDGVHAGHRFVIGEAVKSARETCSPSFVITFDIDPDEVFRPGCVKKLMTNERRIEELSRLDVDGVIVLPFSREFASQEPRAFLEATFPCGAPAFMHVGFDFKFGAGASGTVATLEEFGAARKMAVFGHDLLVMDGAAVTATRIRALLAQGRISAANRLLGHRYEVEGVVQEGRQAGRDMGFRTANLAVPDVIQALGDGVYAAYAHVGDDVFKAAVSVGIPPMFEDEATANIEAHLLDFDGDLYGRAVSVEFVEWLRPMMKFADVDELIDTVMGNIAWVRANL